MNFNRTLPASLLGLALIGAASAHAKPINPAIVSAAAQISVGVGVIDQDYMEKDKYDRVPTSYLNTEKGKIPALAFDVGLVSRSGWYTQLHFINASGETDYNGYLQNSTGTKFKPFKTDTDNSMTGFNLSFGHLFGVTDRIAVAPKAEIGEMEWEREIKDGAGSFYKYSYDHVGAGLEVLYAHTNKLVFSVEGMMGHQSGHVDSDFVTGSIGKTRYTRLSAGVDYAFTESWHVGAQISRMSFESEESHISMLGYKEPASETAHTRAMAHVGYSY